MARTRLVAAVAATTMAVLLTACGGGGAADGSATDGGKAVAVPVAADAAVAKLLPARFKSGINVASGVYAPMEMLDLQQKFTGFDYDLGQALGAKLGVPFTFANQAFDSIIPSLQSGKHQIIMYGMNDTPARRRSLYFVDYFHAGMDIVVRKGNPEKIRGVLDLCGRSVTVAKATTQADLMRAQAPSCEATGKKPITVVELPTEGDSLVAVRAGKGTADVLDAAVAEYTARTAGDGRQFEVVHDAAHPTGYTPVFTGIGVLRKDHDLVLALQAALTSVIKDGTYGRILTKYGLSAYGVTAAEINAG
ncbi:ABC transporter substrate-binding protein [Streptomyces sp. LUP30]|uniref:ABC transporter substrate-binding protein n=1 Tax=Streptomyces sp. LUP30 TaxID=1890285 RepID=UPI000851E39A|nr:ABC transporter substrate-binding protein [Streptomyces sp. LUP30]